LISVKKQARASLAAMTDCNRESWLTPTRPAAKKVARSRVVVAGARCVAQIRFAAKSAHSGYRDQVRW
jgi:hypothetical protein